MSTALDRIPLRPAFAPDYEIARGITTVEAGKSLWVRARHEFSAGAPFSTAQYTLSSDAGSSGVAETLVLRLRDPKDVVQVSIESSVAAGRVAQAMATDPTAERIRLERSGASSIVLARCADKDQSAREPLFASATHVLAAYRKAFRARDVMAAELSRPDMMANPKASK